MVTGRNGDIHLWAVDQPLPTQVDIERTRAFAESAVDFLKTPLVILSEDLRVTKANPAFWKEYGTYHLDADKPFFLEICDGQWDLPGLQAALERVVNDSDGAEALQFEREFTRPDGKTININLCRAESWGEKLIFVSIEDVSERKHAERILLREKQQLKCHVEAGVAELEKTSQLLKSETKGRERVESALHASEYALLKSREELRHLTASLMNAQDAERRRVSRELHDDLSQQVASLQFEIETLEQRVPFTDVQDAKERLRGVGRQAARLSNDLRRVAHQLHPATLDHLGLSVALRSYAEEFSRSTAIAVKFTSVFVPRQVPIELASGLYRIVQEALRNVGKHASDANVEIVLARDPKGLALFIRDNGDGFDVEDVRSKGGLGLISMQERVRLLGGSFAIETRPGKGVLISIQCPLSQEEEQ